MEQLDLFPEEIENALGIKKSEAKLRRSEHGQSFRPSRSFWEGLPFWTTFPWSIIGAAVFSVLAFKAKEFALSDAFMLAICGSDIVVSVLLLLLTSFIACKKLKAIDKDFRDRYPDLIVFT